REERLKLAREHVRRSMLSMMVEQFTYGLVLVGVVALIAGGRLSVGYFAAYWSAAERFRASLSFLLRSLAVIDTDLRYVGDLFDYLDLEEERGPSVKERPRVRGDAAAEPTPTSDRFAATSTAQRVPTIRFEAVSFAFP